MGNSHAEQGFRTLAAAHGDSVVDRLLSVMEPESLTSETDFERAMARRDQMMLARQIKSLIDRSDAEPSRCTAA